MIYDVNRQIELTVASDPEWVSIILQGRSHVDQLSEIDQYRYDAYLSAVLDLWDQLLVRNADGLMDEGMIEDWDIYFDNWVQRFITDSDWQRFKWQYSADIPAKVQAALSTEPLR